LTAKRVSNLLPLALSCGGIAQLVEHQAGSLGVRSSNLLTSTIYNTKRVQKQISTRIVGV
jgi:hypothetical protein